jgi:hypothetical protein
MIAWLRDSSFEMQVTIVASFVLLVIVGFLLFLMYKKIPRKLNQKKYQEKWNELQKLCKNKDTWPEALQQADKLLGEALRQRRFKGKKIGERIVSAQKKLSDNDAVWFAHNLAKKTIEQPEKPLKEADAKKALTGFRQALRDIGALHSGQQDK